jgi:hypothetical protein
MPPLMLQVPHYRRYQKLPPHWPHTNSEAAGELTDESIYEKRMRECFVDVVGLMSYDRNRNCAGRAHGQVVEWRRQMDSLMQVGKSSR